MNERQLESFISAADHKSFSKAANESFISTPALVQQINLLEKSIGFKLFDRTHQGVVLTKAGEMFYQASKEILSIYNNACQKGKEIGQETTLKIAYPFEKFPLFVLSAIQSFHQDHPSIHFEFIPLSFKEHFKAIEHHQVDLSIIGEPQEALLDHLSFIPLYKDTYSFCMSFMHPLARLKKIKQEDLKNQTILIGQYNYLKDSFITQLPQSSNLVSLDHEYDMSACTNVLVSQEMMVIHSLWSDNYTSMLKVIPSNINAGNIGVLCCQEPSKELDLFINYLKKETL